MRGPLRARQGMGTQASLHLQSRPELRGVIDGAPGLPDYAWGIAEVARPGVNLARRQSDAGTRVLEPVGRWCRSTGRWNREVLFYFQLETQA